MPNWASILQIYNTVAAHTHMFSIMPASDSCFCRRVTRNRNTAILKCDRPDPFIGITLTPEQQTKLQTLKAETKAKRQAMAKDRKKLPALFCDFAAGAALRSE